MTEMVAAFAGSSAAAAAASACWRMTMRASEQRLVVEASARVYVVKLVMEVVKPVANKMTAFVEILRLVAGSLPTVFQQSYVGQPLPNSLSEHPEMDRVLVAARAPDQVQICEDDGVAVEARGTDHSVFLSSKPAGRADSLGGTTGLPATVVAALELQAFQASFFSVVLQARRSIYS